MIKLSPSILSADFSSLIHDVAKVERGGAEMLHIDVMDGHFVPNITIGPLIVEALRPKCNMVFDVHLMIENPDLYIPHFAKAGADIISVHAEASRHLHRTIQSIRSQGVKAAVALNPATPLEVLDFVLDDIDMVLLMTVNPGFGGQSFIRGSLQKIKRMREIILARGLDIDIEVDGGINLNNLGEVVEAGANVIVAGSAIFGAEDVEGTTRNFKNSVIK